MLAAVDSLRRRSLIERGKLPGSVMLQSVVLEYVTEMLIEEVTREIEQGGLALLIEHGLSQAGASEYVRQAQERLIVAPILARLHGVYPARAEVEEHLLSLLFLLRERADYAQGYGPANLLALLAQQRGHLRGLDLSQFSIRGAYLQGVEMQDTTLAGAMLRDTVFTEALDAIFAVAISGDGQYWAAGSRCGEVRIWREAGQTLYLLWQAHTDTVSAFAFGPDEHRLATGSWDGTITLWDLEHSVPLWTVWQPTGVLSMAFVPDGRTFVSSGNDAIVRLWDLQSGTSLQTLPHPSPVFAVAWSPDGTRLAGAGNEGNVYVWDTSNGMLLTRLQGHHSRVASVVWSPDGTRLASGGWSRGRGEMFLWDAYSGERLHIFADAPGSVLALDWSPRGELLVSGSSDGMLRWWDVQSGECLRIREGHQGAVQSLRISHDGHRLASCGDDNTIKIWDLESGDLLRTLRRDRPYERLTITGVKGLTEAQKATLRALGAIEDLSVPL